jgi:hypothetical protein
MNQGFDYVAYYNGAYGNDDSLVALAATGANSIEASLEYGIDPQTSTVYPDSNYTDSLAALGATIRQAVGLGLSVMVRPLIDFVDPSDLTGTPYSVGDWRTYFNPGPAGSTTANAFFASYQTLILQEAQVAAANGATSICIGSELDQITGLAYKSYWDSIISALRTDYPSLKLTYAADWDCDLSPWQWGGTGLAAGTGNLATQISFASELDSIGIDGYAPISDAANPTLAQLIAGWTQTPTDPTSLAVTGGQSLISYFESVAAAIGKPLVFTELGYENATDAASQPAGSSTNVVDSSLQAELYQAFFEAWQQAGNSSLTGVYFWNWDPNAGEVGPGEGVNFSPQGLPAQGVATDWFGPGLTITFNAPTFEVNDEIMLTGMASDSTGAQSVELLNGESEFGLATVNPATGAWSFSTTLSAGVYQFGALATDMDGKASSALAAFVVVTGNDNTIDISADSVDFGANSSATITGSSDAIYLNGGDYVAIASGTENVVNNDVVGDLVSLFSNTSTNINGSGGYFEIVGAAVNIAASDDTADTRSDVSFNLVGSNDYIRLGADSSATITGSGDAIHVVATADDASFFGPSAAAVEDDHSSIAVTGTDERLIGADFWVTATGDSDLFIGRNGAIGAADILTASEITTRIAANSNIILYGDDDTVAVRGGAHLNFAGTGLSARVGENADVVISGDGPAGARDTLTGSYFDVSVATSANVELATIDASATLVDDVAFTVERANNTINAGNSDTISILWGDFNKVLLGQDDVISDGGSGSMFEVGGNVGATAIKNFGADPLGVIDLLNDVGGYATAQHACNALTSDGAGGVELSLGADGSIDFSGAAATQFTAANFKIG